MRGTWRVALTIVVAALAIQWAAPSARAAWSPGSIASGRSSALTVGPPVAAAASAKSSSSVDITWDAPGPASATPSQYLVRRTAPTTAPVCTVDRSTFTCRDNGLDAATTYTYTVEARIGSWSSGETPGFQARTPLPPAFTVTPAPDTTAGTTFSIGLTATTDGVTRDTTYSGPHVLTFSGPSASPDGDVPTYPATVTFSAGIGVASVTLVAAESAVLTVSDGTRNGTAPVIVAAAASNRLTFTNSTPSCSSGSVTVGSRGSFTSKVTVVDAYGNPVEQAAATLIAISRSPALGSLTPKSLTVAKGGSESTASVTYRRPRRFGSSVSVSASRTGLTSVTCEVLAN